MLTVANILRDCRDSYLRAANGKAWRDRYSERVEIYPGGVHAFEVSSAGGPEGGRVYRVLGFDPFNPAQLARFSPPSSSSAEAWRAARAALAAEGWHVPGPTSKLRREGLANYPIAVRKGPAPAYCPAMLGESRGNGRHWAAYVSHFQDRSVFTFAALGLPGTAQPLSFTGITAGPLALETLTAEPIGT